VSLVETPDELSAEAGVRNYTLVCLVALLIVTLVLIDEAGPWVLLPVAIGGLGLVGRWRSTVPLFLLTVGFVVMAVAQGGDPFFFLLRILRLVLLGRAGPGPGMQGRFSGGEPTFFGDFLICAAVLAYAAGHYRLLALTRQVFPLESQPGGPRKQPGARPRPTPPLRSGNLVTPGEIGTLLLTLPIWIGVGGGVLLWLAILPNPLAETPREIWRVLVLIWVTGIGLALVTAALGYLGMRRAPPGEARTYLQDVLWRETASEQGRLNRWLTWARLRGQRRKEESK
jgi:hypothetical protein